MPKFVTGLRSKPRLKLNTKRIIIKFNILTMKTTKRIITLFIAISMVSTMFAQDWYKINAHYGSDYNFEWSFPYSIDQISHFSFSKKGEELRAHRIDEVPEVTTYIPFLVEDVDSVTFEYETPEEEQTHNKYKVFTINITTNGAKPVSSKEEYVPCYVSVDGKGEYDNYSGPAKIRGRGNSTWSWYDKKPYRIKLDQKHKILGLAKNRDWVLLANWRDPTDLMNAFVYEVADWMGMSYVNNTRFVEVFLNGDYIGLYQLTEQIEQGGHRVDIAENGGILLEMDLDDGPSLSPDATNNFWSKVYSMPMCVKYPDNPTLAQVDSVKALLGELETVIKQSDYDTLDSLMDMRSFMTMAMIQEYVYNVEICAPRSIYMYKDVDGKWFMGPFWDWDAAFCFDWGDMYTGHIYFGSYGDLVLGSDPAKQSGGTPRYFTDMFKNARYTKEYKELWNSVKDSIFTRNWAVMEKYIENLKDGPYDRDEKRWPIYKPSSGGGWGSRSKLIDIPSEIESMKTWLQNRTAFMDQVINAYPDGSVVTEDFGITSILTKNNTIIVNAKMDAAGGYGQSFSIDVDQDLVASILGVSPNSLTESTLTLNPLNADGNIGQNTAAGRYGAWFSGEGYTTNWGNNSHVYIEANQLFSWGCGCYPGICNSGDAHTVYMQYGMTINGEIKTVNVKVNFGLNITPKDDGTLLPDGYEGGSGDEYEEPEGGVDPSLFSYKNMSRVGYETLTAIYDMDKVASYSKQNISIDLNSVLSKFPSGTKLDDLVYAICSNRETGELTTAKTSSNGYYMMFDGTAVAWGNSECKIGYNPSSNTLDFAYTADIETPVSGARCTASVFLIYNSKYFYEFKMNITLK